MSACTVKRFQDLAGTCWKNIVGRLHVGAMDPSWPIHCAFIFSSLPCSGLRTHIAVVQRAIVDSPESQSQHSVKNSRHNTTPSFAEIQTEIANHLGEIQAPIEGRGQSKAAPPSGSEQSWHQKRKTESQDHGHLFHRKEWTS